MDTCGQALRSIFHRALRDVDVAAAVRRRIWFEGPMLHLGSSCCEVSGVDRVLLVAVGKAATPMYEGALLALSGRVAVEAVVVAPAAPSSTTNVVFCAAAHPIPDERSKVAAETVLAKLREASEKTVVLFLVSGGASAMLELPLDPAISVADVAEFHRRLVGSGLPIGEMNALRKHFSAVKGGRLAVAASKAQAMETMLVSDVPGGSLDTVGSGPSLPDSSTTADCRASLEVLQSGSALPASVAAFFAGPLFVESPKADDPAFARHGSASILSSADLAEAAARAAAAVGFEVVVDNTCDEWNYRDAGRYLLQRARELAERYPKLCLISTGELSVPLEGPAGLGGRNQHFALWCALELAKGPDGLAVLSAGSDGIDGQSPAAGAVADGTTCERAQRLGLEPEACLQDYDSYSLFNALGDAIVTGPTGNNLRDLRLIVRCE